MKISKIEKRKNKYNVVLSDGKSLSFYEETILKYNLLKPQKIDDKLWQDILKENNFWEVYYTVLKYINYKMRTKKEIRYKFKDVDKDILSKVILQLEKIGYLNDCLYIKCFINDKVSLSTSGPRKIKLELLDKGFKEDEINKSLAEIADDVWMEKVSKIANKKVNSNRKDSSKVFILKLKNYLYNLGYDKDVIEFAIQDLDIQDNLDTAKLLYDKLHNKYSQKYDGYILKQKIKEAMGRKGYSFQVVENFWNNTRL